MEVARYLLDISRPKCNFLSIVVWSTDGCDRTRLPKRDSACTLPGLQLKQLRIYAIFFTKSCRKAAAAGVAHSGCHLRNR